MMAKTIMKIINLQASLYTDESVKSVYKPNTASQDFYLQTKYGSSNTGLWSPLKCIKHVKLL